MRKVIYTTLILSIMLCLAACGKKTKTEAEVEKDILGKYSSLEEYQGQEGYSFEVTLRKTDSKNGTDEVQCLITFSDEIRTSIAEVTVKYYLYDQGLILENIDVTNSKTTPLKATVKLQQAIKDFELYASKPKNSYYFLGDEKDLENSKHTFYFEDSYRDITYELIYSFKAKWDGGYEWIVSEINEIAN